MLLERGAVTDGRSIHSSNSRIGEGACCFMYSPSFSPSHFAFASPWQICIDGGDDAKYEESCRSTPQKMGITRSVKFTVNSTTSREGDIRSLTYFDNVRERVALPEEEGEDGEGREANLPSASSSCSCPSRSSSLHLVKAASYGVFAAVRGC